MRGFKTTTAPSRLGRKQISIYVEPGVAERLRSVCAARRSTMQHLLGTALNAYLSDRGFDEALSNPRLSSPRPIRAAARTTQWPGRTGRIAINGWYEGAEVDRIRKFATAIDSSIQAIGEAAIFDFLNLDKIIGEDASSARRSPDTVLESHPGS